ncbi:MAG: DUF2235 domain-containing protein [Bryobacteraceae bacterium]
MPKNIVICCDGTGNKFSDQNTNVVKLYYALDMSNPGQQIGYYHAGLGTIGAPGALSKAAQERSKIFGLAFGSGIGRDIGDAYAFLMDMFEPGDRLFLFGFSRGAFTVRALAGMLHMFGLLRPGNLNLIRYAVQMLTRKQDGDTFDVASQFRGTFSIDCPVYFTGVWDTVSSVGWIWDPLHVPYTARNSSLAIGRHAVSIDERRCFFRQNLWGAPCAGQDLRTVWFAGVHSDVGGGYPEAQSGLSKITLEWMMCEAGNAGLLFQPERAAAVLGMRGAPFVAPDAGAMLHNSLRFPWILLEPLPHLYWDMTCEPPRERVRLPLGAPRRIPNDAILHESVARRIALGIGYRPPNLPARPGMEPWRRLTAVLAGGGDAS